MDKIIINSITGEQLRTTSRAWWTDGALDKGKGRIEVARINAESLTRKYASQADIDAGLADSIYQDGPDYTGKPVSMMIGLTEAELAEHGFVPGLCTGYDVVDGRRPASNRTDKFVTMGQYQRAIDALQNEGC